MKEIGRLHSTEHCDSSLENLLLNLQIPYHWKGWGEEPSVSLVAKVGDASRVPSASYAKVTTFWTPFWTSTKSVHQLLHLCVFGALVGGHGRHTRNLSSCYFVIYWTYVPNACHFHCHSESPSTLGCVALAPIQVLSVKNTHTHWWVKLSLATWRKRLRSLRKANYQMDSSPSKTHSADMRCWNL